ncbi:MAG TPA: hypothetical protein VF517_16620 [Thermoleophilaceae bacterium]
MDDDQMERFGEAVEQKKQESRERSEQTRDEPGSPGAVDGDQPDLVEQGPQDVRDERKKNSGHGKVTADKWNQ